MSKPKTPEKPPAARVFPPPKNTKEERLAKALRQNLLRRKQAEKPSSGQA